MNTQESPNVVASTTQAGGGDISPAPENRSTSLAACIPGEVSGVVEPPKPEALPAEACSDEKDRSIETLRSEYVNIHPYCLHLWRQIGANIPMPDSILVGFKETA